MRNRRTYPRSRLPMRPHPWMARRSADVLEGHVRAVGMQKVLEILLAHEVVNLAMWKSVDRRSGWPHWPPVEKFDYQGGELHPCFLHSA